MNLLLLGGRARAGGAAFRARTVLVLLDFLVRLLRGGPVAAGARSLARSGGVLRLRRCIGSSHQEWNRRDRQECRCK